MLRLLFRYTNLMYPKLACRIRHHFALLASYAYLWVSFTNRFSRAIGLDTNALSSYYKLFYYVVRIELIVFHPTFWISPVEQVNIFSDQVVLFRTWANETHLKCAKQVPLWLEPQ